MSTLTLGFVHLLLHRGLELLEQEAANSNSRDNDENYQDNDNDIVVAVCAVTTVSTSQRR